MILLVHSEVLWEFSFPDYSKYGVGTSWNVAHAHYSRVGVHESCHFCSTAFIALSLFSETTVTMAEAPDPVEKGLEELDEEITCPVC